LKKSEVKKGKAEVAIDIVNKLVTFFSHAQNKYKIGLVFPGYVHSLFDFAQEFKCNCR